MKRKSTLVLKKEALLSTQTIGEDESSQTKAPRKRKPPNCSIITTSTCSKKRLKNALPDIETLLLCPTEDLQPESLHHFSGRDDCQVITPAPVGDEIASSPTLDLSHGSQSGRLSQSQSSLDVNHQDYVELSVADLEQGSSSLKSVDVANDDSSNNNLSANETEFLGSQDATEESQTPFVLLVDSDPLIDASTISSIDSSLLTCDVTLPSAVLGSESDETELDACLERFNSNNDSVDLTTSKLDRSNQMTSKVTYLLESFEKERRKGSICDRWAKQPRRKKCAASEKQDQVIENDPEKVPDTFTSQWTATEVELLIANINSCAKMYQCSPEQIIHDWNRGTRGDFYKIVSTGINRPLNSVYRKAQRLYPKPLAASGKFSQEEKSLLVELQEEHGSDWVRIGEIMGRSAESVRNKFRCLKLARKNDGAWSEEEVDRLKRAVFEIYGKEKVPVVNMSWNKIEKKVKTRNAQQCRIKWVHSLYSQVAGSAAKSKWTTDDTLQVLEHLISSDASHEDQVDWVDLSSKLRNVRSPQWLRRLWSVELKKTIGNGEKLEFKEALTKLQKFFHECNQLFQSNLDVCEEDLISNYTCSILDCHDIDDVIAPASEGGDSSTQQSCRSGVLFRGMEDGQISTGLFGSCNDLEEEFVPSETIILT